MNEQELQLQIVQLVQAAMSGDLQATQLILQIMLAAQQGNLQAAQIAQMIQAVALQMQGGTEIMRNGAKINYLRHLRGQCPEGTETLYYKVGGRICKKCVLGKKMQDGGLLPDDPIEAYKCGRKMRKHG